jgi:hypothetical protein
MNRVSAAAVARMATTVISLKDPCAAHWYARFPPIASRPAAAAAAPRTPTLPASHASAIAANAAKLAMNGW